MMRAGAGVRGRPVLVIAGVVMAATLSAGVATGAPRTKPAPQTAAVQMLPQLAAAGADAQPAAAAQSVISAAFTPIAAGRPVSLQVQSGRKWSTVAHGAEDAGGRVLFTAAYAVGGSPATYRAVAEATRTQAQVASATVRTDRWGTPLLTDEFSGVGLAFPWDHRLQGYVGNRQCSRADASATVVAAGLVRLSVLDDPDKGDCTDPQGRVNAYRLNGHIGTQGRFAFRYGFAAARIRFQPLRGQHGAFWMQPNAPAVQGGDPSVSGAEIDAVEWFGTGSGGLASNAYYYSQGVLTQTGGWIPDQPSFGSGWADQFHVFSVEWTPTEYVFRIDGRESFRTSEGVSQIPEYLILSLLSSDFELSLLGGTQNLPQTMAVDWVRVWGH